MRDSVEIFEKLLERFRFREPVPADVREIIASQKSKALILTLIAVGDYSVLYGLVIKAYYLVRRFGLRLSVFQSKILLVRAVAFSLSSSAGAVYVIQAKLRAVDRSIPVDLPSRQPPVSGKAVVNEKTDAFQKGISRTGEPAKGDPGIVVSYRLGIADLKSETVSGVESGRIKKSLLERLVQLKGPDKIIALTANRNRTANFILFSSIEKIENSYILTAKIVDVEKGNVVFATSENAETANSITTACERLADRVSLQVP